MSLHNLFYLVLFTLAPVFELRWSIPLGLWNKPIDLPFVGVINGFGMPVFEVLPIVIITNILLGLFLYFALDFLVRVFTRVQYIKVLYNRIVERTQRKVKPYVEKYGVIGLAIFIGIPLPGSGVWTGALAAYLLGVRFRDFAIACVIGVLIAAAMVTVVTLGVLNGFWI